MRVLVIEDEDALTRVLRGVLEDAGHVVTSARTTAETARLAGPWDVVLVSGLPASWRALDETDGAELRALATLAPVVLLADRPWMAGARPPDLGVAAIVRKTFDLDQLLDAVRAVGERA
jgi:DNA-binding response OmpR family regulator